MHAAYLRWPGLPPRLGRCPNLPRCETQDDRRPLDRRAAAAAAAGLTKRTRWRADQWKDQRARAAQTRNIGTGLRPGGAGLGKLRLGLGVLQLDHGRLRPLRCHGGGGVSGLKTDGVHQAHVPVQPPSRTTGPEHQRGPLACVRACVRTPPPPTGKGGVTGGSGSYSPGSVGAPRPAAAAVVDREQRFRAGLGDALAVAAVEPEHAHITPHRVLTEAHAGSGGSSSLTLTNQIEGLDPADFLLPVTINIRKIIISSHPVTRASTGRPL